MCVAFKLIIYVIPNMLNYLSFLFVLSLTGKQYLVVSSDNEQDRLWSKKLCKILNKKGHQAYWLHDVDPGSYLRLFYQVSLH